MQKHCTHSIVYMPLITYKTVPSNKDGEGRPIIMPNTPSLIVPSNDILGAIVSTRM